MNAMQVWHSELRNPDTKLLAKPARSRIRSGSVYKIQCRIRTHLGL
jgi:hypothetical protein